MWLAATPAHAQGDPDGGLPDAAVSLEDAGADAGSDGDGGLEDGGAGDGGQYLPDGSVGGGGADRDNPEGEDGTGRVQLDCRISNRCDPGFDCVAGRCAWTGIRDAEGPGCALGSTLAAVALGLALFGRRRG